MAQLRVERRKNQGKRSRAECGKGKRGKYLQQAPRPGTSSNGKFKRKENLFCSLFLVNNKWFSSLYFPLFFIHTPKATSSSFLWLCLDFRVKGEITMFFISNGGWLTGCLADGLYRLPSAYINNKRIWGAFLHHYTASDQQPPTPIVDTYWKNIPRPAWTFISLRARINCGIKTRVTIINLLIMILWSCDTI